MNSGVKQIGFFAFGRFGRLNQQGRPRAGWACRGYVDCAFRPGRRRSYQPRFEPISASDYMPENRYDFHFFPFRRIPLDLLSRGG